MNQPSHPSTPSARPLYRAVAGFDFSPLGERAIIEGLKLCSREPRAELHVVAVGTALLGGVLLPGPEPRTLPEGEARDFLRARVAQLCERQLAVTPCPGLEKVVVCLADGLAAERIMALATAVDADVIVVGTHGRRGLSRMVLGSVAEEVVR